MAVCGMVWLVIWLRCILHSNWHWAEQINVTQLIQWNKHPRARLMQSQAASCFSMIIVRVKVIVTNIAQGLSRTTFWKFCKRERERPPLWDCSQQNIVCKPWIVLVTPVNIVTNQIMRMWQWTYWHHRSCWYWHLTSEICCDLVSPPPLLD